MTRGLYPPESLSKDDIKTMNEVRMNIWSNAMTGLGAHLNYALCIVLTARRISDKMNDIFSLTSDHVSILYVGFGSGSGLVMHTAMQYANKFGIIKSKLNRNTLFMAVLGGGALGSFLFATAKGKESVHNLHSIFQVGANPKTDPGYYRTVIKAKEEESKHQKNLQQSSNQEASSRQHDTAVSVQLVEGDGKLLTDSEASRRRQS
jgi:hypothetical protein